jgi:hypothetical protein
LLISAFNLIDLLNFEPARSHVCEKMGFFLKWGSVAAGLEENSFNPPVLSPINSPPQRNLFWRNLIQGAGQFWFRRVYLVAHEVAAIFGYVLVCSCPVHQFSCDFNRGMNPRFVL